MKFIIRYIFICLFILVKAHAVSQVQNLRFEHYTTKNGLIDNLVLDIHLDKNGYLWVCALGGVCKFDGYQFEVIDEIRGASQVVECHDGQFWFLDSRCVSRYNAIKGTVRNYFVFTRSGKYLRRTDFNKLFVSRDSSIWLAYEKGVAKYNKDQDRFEEVYTFDTLFNKYSGSFDNSFAEVDEYILLGGPQGVLAYHKADGTFQNHVFRGSSNDSTPMYVTSIICSSKGEYWIGTKQNGVFRYQSLEDLFKDRNRENFFRDQYYYSDLRERVSAIFEGSNGDIWVGTNVGASVISESGVQHFLDGEQYLDAKKSNRIRGFFEDSRGNLWMTKIGSVYGVAVLDQSTRELRVYSSREGSENSLSYNSVSVVKEDHSGNVWIGTIGGGLNKVGVYQKDFRGIQHAPGTSRTINSNMVYGLCQEEDGQLWIGTDKGLNSFDQKSGEAVSYSFRNSGLGGRSVSAIERDMEGNYWIGFFESQLSKYMTATDEFINYKYNKKPPFLFEAWSVKDILAESNENVWVTTSNGLFRYDLKKGAFFQYNENPTVTLFKDRHGTLWVSGGGFTLARINKEKNKIDDLFTYYLPDSSSLPVNCMHDCNLDPANKNLLWIGTYKGLMIYDPGSGSIVEHGKNVGLPEVVILGILEDQEGNLWISTKKGLFHYNPITNDCRIYTVNDGLFSNEFNHGSFLKGRNGFLYFGSSNGLLYFHPDSIEDNQFLPNPAITKLEVNRKTMYPGLDINDQVVLKNTIEHTKRLVLNHRNKDFTLYFSALHYTSPLENKYNYRLEGYDKDKGWYETSGEKNFVTYTNLGHGEYIFYLKAANSDGVWNPKPLKLEISILPAWYETLLFKSSVALFVMVSLLVFYLVKINNAKKQQRILETRVKERTLEIEMQKEEINSQSELLKENNEELTRMNATKDKFFSIIAHDLRNPFQSITGMAGLLIDKRDNMEKEKLDGALQMIYNASKGASILLENLLDWSRSQLNQVQFKPGYFTIEKVVDETIRILKIHADNKKIELINNARKPIAVYADKNMLTTVIRNLISNAIKFTRENGRVRVVSTSGQKVVEICIEDSGIGMEEDKVKELFNINSQKSMTGTSGERGTGLGLLVCKEFMDKMGGTIQVESKKGTGTKFILQLPVDKNVHGQIKEQEDQKDEKNEKGRNEDEKIVEDKFNEIPSGIYEELKRQKEKYQVLVIDDNPEIIQGLTALFKEFFMVESASNGKEGLKKAFDLTPDLIISDLSMPGMDGVEVCEKLKKDDRTSHIPIIMLTARSANIDRIEGLNVGVDDYITKPIEPQVLIVRIRNLIRSRRQLLENFNQDTLLTPEKYTVNKSDEVFIKQVIDVIEENMGAIDFNVQTLTIKMKMSKTNVYRKVKSITGQSVHDFIKTVRLKRASNLIKSGKVSVSEAAMETGFKTTAHFSREFKAQFGVTPSKFGKRE